MEQVDERAAGSPACPKCRSREVGKLARRATVQLWECRKLDCLEGFSTTLTPAEIAAQAAADRLPPAPNRPSDEEVLAMAKKGRMDCGKGCGRDFVHPKRKETHEKACKGPKEAQASPRAKELSARLKRDRAPASKPAARAPRASTVGAGDGHVAAALEELRDRREVHVRAIEQIDELLPALEKFRDGMGGGVAPTLRPRSRAA